MVELSYCWFEFPAFLKSILCARKFISLGAKWRFVDGSQIWIYNDSWLHGDLHGQILLPISTLLKDVIISVLLIQIQDGGTRLLLIWISCLLKLKKSRQYLYVQLYIQITCTGPIAEMVHMWLNLAISYYVKKKIEIQLSNSDAIISFWRIIWTSKLSGKIKNFMWKACSKRMKIIIKDMCVNYVQNKSELSLYALWDCDF